MAGITIGAIGSALGGLAQGAITAIKIVVSISFALIFFTAIMTLLGFLQSMVALSVVGEFFALISVCLPFSPAFVFTSIVLITDAILAFMIARKIYDLSSQLIKTSGA